MNVLLLVTIITCKWISYSQEELRVEPQNLMLSGSSMLLVGTCGGTDHLKIEFSTFEYCQRKHILKATGVVKEYRTEELYPFCSIANAEAEGKVVPKSEIFTTDIDGNFSIEMSFQKDDKLVFFNTGTEVVVITMPEN